MKAIDIALKDIWHSFRNAMFIVFGLGLPLATGALFYFAFGGRASGDGGFDLAPTQVQIVNLDQGMTGFSAGKLLVTILQEAIPDLIHAREVSDPEIARTAVDIQDAAVAIIVPADFTAAILDLEGQSSVEIYTDPTLTLGPSIVTGVVSQIVDGFAGAKIATTAAYGQLSAYGAEVDPSTGQEIAMQYAEWSSALDEGQQPDRTPLFEIQSPPVQGQEQNGGVGQMLGLVVAGMMVFYVFFTGAAAAQSILLEEEAGTLPRLFTTPTPQSTILAGKIISSFLLLSVQVFLLVIITALIFDISWGQPILATLVIIGLVVVASSFGICITSFLKDSRQGGIIYGGVMTVMGMVGMLPIFTAANPASSNAFETASLIVPQGWGVRGWRLLVEGGSVGDILLTVAVMLVAGLVFFLVGVLRFRKRYA